jgi:hypothetical protein
VAVVLLMAKRRAEFAVEAQSSHGGMFSPANEPASWCRLSSRLPCSGRGVVVTDDGMRRACRRSDALS